MKYVAISAVLFVSLLLTSCMTDVYTRHQNVLAQLELGMTEQEVTQLAGRPYRINNYARGTMRQWIYNKPCPFGKLFQPAIFLYFENGRLTSWDELACY